MDHVDWFRREAGTDTAERFAIGVTGSFDRLARSPGLGAVVDVTRGELANARKWRVEGFPRLLIFYLPRDDAIRVLRVLHAARDWR